MDYLERLTEYQKELKGIEIGGRNHLEVISKKPEEYLKRAEELQARVAGEKFLMKEDKERLLREINENIELIGQSGPKKDDSLLTYALIFLAGICFDRFIFSDSGSNDYLSDLLLAFKDAKGEIGK
jgi:hypothetical protein